MRINNFLTQVYIVCFHLASVQVSCLSVSYSIKNRCNCLSNDFCMVTRTKNAHYKDNKLMPVALKKKLEHAQDIVTFG